MNKIIEFLKKNWTIIINYLIIFISYSIVYNHPEVVWAEFLLGIWLFVSAGFGLYKWFMGKPKK